MATAKLTERLIETLELPGIVWDSEIKGFGLRIMAKGTRTFFLNYRTHGKQRRMKLGRVGIMSLEDARKKARQLLNSLADGADPIGERERARAAVTFTTLAQEYIARRCAEKKSGFEDVRIIRRELLPTWGARLASDVRRRDVLELTDAIKERGAPIMANRTLSLVRRLFNFGLERELVETNPALRVRLPAKETSRDRVLNVEEIRAFWHGLDLLPCDPQIRAALRLILVTAQRPAECAGLTWAEIDRAEIWTIPGRKSKSGRPQRVPLSSLALELLNSLPHGTVGAAFPSYNRPGRPITRGAMANFLSRNREKLGLERFTPHDLRRSAASGMASMGTPRFVLARILGHSDKGTTAIYDKHSYDPEKRAALEAWGARLQDIIAGRLVGI